MFTSSSRNSADTVMSEIPVPRLLALHLHSQIHNKENFLCATMRKLFGKQNSLEEEKSNLGGKEALSSFVCNIIKDLFFKRGFNENVAFPYLKRFIKLYICKCKALISYNY